MGLDMGLSVSTRLALAGSATHFRDRFSPRFLPRRDHDLTATTTNWSRRPRHSIPNLTGLSQGLADVSTQRDLSLADLLQPPRCPHYTNTMASYVAPRRGCAYEEEQALIEFFYGAELLNLPSARLAHLLDDDDFFDD